jgi:hypothetical protein
MRSKIVTPASDTKSSFQKLMGMIGVWNRSRNEDVLIVRVHKLLPKKVWKARYDQINRFEEILSENGMTIVKLKFHISKDEQKKRLQARLDRPDKWWKFNPNDIKERVFWNDRQQAYEDAIKCARPIGRRGTWSRQITKLGAAAGKVRFKEFSYGRRRHCPHLSTHFHSAFE